MVRTFGRLYDGMLQAHLQNLRQMAFVTGARQVGKTTTCRAQGSHYLSWDDTDDRRNILKGPAQVASVLSLERLSDAAPVVVFDELHKHRRWRVFLKGFFDKFGDRCRVIVTGSSRFDIFRRGGDSLMGRYFLYRMHPLSVGELVRTTPPESAMLVAPPARLPSAKLMALQEHGGFPEPFLHADPAFSRRWRRLRTEQLVRHDLRDLTQIADIDRVATLVELLSNSSATQLNYASLARDLDASVDSIRRWISTLSAMYLGFSVRPWFRNVKKALRKEPRWFLTDWSMVKEPGPRAETLTACHLLKAVQTWTDLGLGDFELRYLRDKAKREVDFAIIRDGEPWFLVEVKRSETVLSPHLAHFQAQTGAAHAFQAVMDLPHVARDCFERRDPCVVPLWTLLSQLP